MTSLMTTTAAHKSENSLG